jgi:hypothetical protein
MIFVTHIHLVGGERHEHISRVRWRNPGSGQSGESTREEMVLWIGEEGGEAWVTDGVRNARVGVVRAHPPYIRTYADGVWTDNLLALPRY